MRILFITNTPPLPTQGGAMTFFRHFVERDDFEIAVITDDKSIKQHNVDYPYKIINPGQLGARIRNSRLHKLEQSYRRIVGVRKLHSSILKFAQEFEPDAIFTVGGSWTWMAIIAAKAARKLQLPLIGSFNDWWDYCATYHTSTAYLIEKRFRSFYKKCDLAICTSEGMHRELGPHKNTVILYPSGAKLTERTNFTPAISKFIIGFGGNLGDWYGPMLERLINATPDIEYNIFGFNPSWSSSFDKKMKSKGFYKGSVNFEQLKQEMHKCDALILLMGFGDSCAMVEKTSFKTKFLDYLTFQRPIILWGPDYCSAAIAATEFDSAEICTDNNAESIATTIYNLRDAPARQTQLVCNGQTMYNERFNPDNLHQLLVKSISKTVKTNKVKND